MIHRVVRFWVLVILLFGTLTKVQADLGKSATRDLVPDACDDLGKYLELREQMPELLPDENEKIKCLRLYNEHIESCTRGLAWTWFSLGTGKYEPCIAQFDQKYPYCAEHNISSDELKKEIQQALESWGMAPLFSQAVLSSIYQMFEDFVRCLTAGLVISGGSPGQSGGDKFENKLDRAQNVPGVNPLLDTSIGQWATDNSNSEFQILFFGKVQVSDSQRACFNTALNTGLGVLGNLFPASTIALVVSAMGVSFQDCVKNCVQSGRLQNECKQVCGTQAVGGFIGQMALFQYVSRFSRSGGQKASSAGDALVEPKINSLANSCQVNPIVVENSVPQIPGFDPRAAMREAIAKKISARTRLEYRDVVALMNSSDNVDLPIGNGTCHPGAHVDIPGLGNITRKQTKDPSSVQISQAINAAHKLSQARRTNRQTTVWLYPWEAVWALKEALNANLSKLKTAQQNKGCEGGTFQMRDRRWGLDGRGVETGPYLVPFRSLTWRIEFDLNGNPYLHHFSPKVE